MTVTVTASGDYGATTGWRIVTIPASGSATFTVATSHDLTDESDGSVTTTINTGSGYTGSRGQGDVSTTSDSSSVDSSMFASPGSVSRGCSYSNHSGASEWVPIEPEARDNSVGPPDPTRQQVPDLAGHLLPSGLLVSAIKTSPARVVYQV